jgi:hypothetical protein
LLAKYAKYRQGRQEAFRGTLVFPQVWPIGRAIGELQIVWACAELEDLRNRIVYLPL